MPMWWQRWRRRKERIAESAGAAASSSDGESTQVHALCSGQSGAEAATASASCSSSSPCFSTRIQCLSERRKDFDSELAFEIESSKSHWTELSVATSRCDSEVERLPNSVVFEKLKEHPEWGSFFQRPPYRLEIGRKIAEGGQAEIFEAYGPSETDPSYDQWSNLGRYGNELVVKVYKGGFSLQDLQHLWPPGLASFAHWRTYAPYIGNLHGVCCPVGVQLLEDGRFAFILDRYRLGDLRKFIDGRMLKSNGTPPFVFKDTHQILGSIARGMADLHYFGLLHRDLKASNVLMFTGRFSAASRYAACITDFESSVGIVGTGFWRAPEVLLALNTRTLTAETLTQKSDVFSYAMTCYEVITGLQPFEGHPQSDYGVVLGGERPALPDETPSELKALVRRCWHQDPLQRPSFDVIVKDLDAMADSVKPVQSPTG